MKLDNKDTVFRPENGFYGRFGGAFIPEMLYENVSELEKNYLSIMASNEFRSAFKNMLTEYAGRPTPLSFAPHLSKKYGFQIYLKREDLNHTGSHKLNNVIGQALIAIHLGKKRIIAETGAGQHGVATATICARMGIPCTVFMGEIDYKRQYPNVLRMRLLGADVIPVKSGSRTLKDATNEAIRQWLNDPVKTYYLIGSAIGPHPYPDMVSRLQSVISEEIQQQLGKQQPDVILACVGGGSNAMGAFYHYIGSKTRLIGVEAGGCGAHSKKTAATLTLGKPGILHGCLTYLLQNKDGQIQEAHSVSAGLDYPGVGPGHAYLNQQRLAEYVWVTDTEALEAAGELARLEGIIPALESSHALAYLAKLDTAPGSLVLVNLSGRGDKDMNAYIDYFFGDH